MCAMTYMLLLHPGGRARSAERGQGARKCVTMESTRDDTATGAVIECSNILMEEEKSTVSPQR